MTLGSILKEEGRERVAARNEEWLAWMRSAARLCVKANGDVSTDDLHIQAFALELHRGLVPTHKNAWGAIFAEKGWKRIGYVQSKRPEAHARPIGVWIWEGDNHE